MATILNYEVDEALAPPRVAFYAYTGGVRQIWGQDNIAATRLGKPTGFDWTLGGSGGVAVPGEGQIFPQGIYAFQSDVKQKIVEVDFGGAPTYTKVQDVIDAEVTTGVSVICVQVGQAPTGRQIDENEMDMFDIVGCPGVPANGTLRLYISSRMPVAGKYKFGYTIGTL